MVSSAEQDVERATATGQARIASKKQRHLEYKGLIARFHAWTIGQSPFQGMWPMAIRSRPGMRGPGVSRRCDANGLVVTQVSSTLTMTGKFAGIAVSSPGMRHVSWVTAVGFAPVSSLMESVEDIPGTAPTTVSHGAGRPSQNTWMLSILLTRCKFLMRHYVMGERMMTPLNET